VSQHSQRANYLLELSRYDLAEEEAHKLLSSEPYDPEGHTIIARCRIHQGKFPEALDEARRAMLRAPYWAYPHYLISLVFRCECRLPEAETASREALRLSPRDADYYGALAEVLAFQKKWHDALTVVDRGLQINPKHLACLHCRVRILDSLRRTEEAHGTIDLLLQLYPEDAFAHANKGLALLNKDIEAAKKHLREALRIEPTWKQVQKCLQSVEQKSSRQLGWGQTSTPRQAGKDKEGIHAGVVIFAVAFLLMHVGRIIWDNSSHYPRVDCNPREIRSFLTVQTTSPNTKAVGWNLSPRPIADLCARPAPGAASNTLSNILPAMSSQAILRAVQEAQRKKEAR
jgi:Flp pilus assembly protein TadD